MPPKSNAKKKLVSPNKCRRSRRIAYKIKSMVKGPAESPPKQPEPPKERRQQSSRKRSVERSQPSSSDEEQSSTAGSEKPLSRQKSVTKRQPESSNEGQSTSTKKSTVKNAKPSCSRKSTSKRQPASTSKGLSTSTKKSTVKNPKPSCSKKSASKRQLAASSSEGQSTSTKKSTAKKRRVTEMDEINERASQLGLEDTEDFSNMVKEISKELLPDFEEISEEAVAEMNVYLNHAFERLARASAILLIGRNDDLMTEKDVETAVVQVVEGDLAKYCVVEGRRAVKKMNEK